MGGGLTAELGTMRVTEQIDALIAMGSSPLRVLVVPRFLACVLLIPILVVYADFMGILGGYAVSVYIYGVNGAEFWRHAASTVDNFDARLRPDQERVLRCGHEPDLLLQGLPLRAGAAGVGRACTESFVASCMAILALDFFLGMLLNTIYESIYGLKLIL